SRGRRSSRTPPRPRCSGRATGCGSTAWEGTTSTSAELDPITLSVVWHRLESITREIGAVMAATARSPIFSEAHDFSCFLTDAAGVVVTQADGLPIHTGCGGTAVRAVLARFAGDL